MTVLSSTELKTRCESLSDSDKKTCEEYEAIKDRYETLELHMDETADLMFSNHVMCLLKRIKTGEYVPPMDEELFSELSEQARDMAFYLVGDVFVRSGHEPDKTEVLMLATHLEVALANQRKGES